MSDEHEGQGITLLGAEMLTWSDAEGETGAFGGLLAPHLVHGFGSARGRALVAGPTSAAVVAGIAARFTHTDVLVRSFPDAEALRAELPITVGVVCGPLDRLARRRETYDAVIAVAGTDRLHTAEEDTPTPAAVLDDLASLVSDGGELFLGVGNPVGIDRLLSLAASSSHHDADWPEGLVVATAPLSVDDSLAVLGAAGLAPVETWHCHGRRSDPLVAAPSATFTTRATDTVLLREAGRAYDVLDPSAPAIKDPAATARDLVRAGLGAATAPLTVLHLRRGGVSVPTSGPTSGPADAVLVSEPAHDGSPAVAYRLVPGAAGWARELLTEPVSVAVAAGLTRDTAALVGPVPSGPTLAEAIETACAAHDASSAGVLVRRYAEWLGPDPVPAEKVAVTPALLAVSSDGLELLDASWTAAAAQPRDVVLSRGLLDLAADLLARGVRHPWSPAAPARLVATSLIAAAGIEAEAALLEAAVALDATLRPAGTAPDYDVPGNSVRRSYAELAELAADAASRAADSDEHVLWLLRRLQGRQRALRATRGRMHQLETSREMWIGRRIFVLRSLVRRWRTKRELKRTGPAGEWRDPATIQQTPEDDPNLPFTVEEQLLPPGYRPPADKAEVIPSEGD